jgi:hypothetical protein
MARISEGGIDANGWSGNTTTVDLARPLGQDIETALRRSHNITDVRVETHRLTVHVTIDNPAGDGDAQQLLRDYLKGPWKEKSIY